MCAAVDVQYLRTGGARAAAVLAADAGFAQVLAGRMCGTFSVMMAASLAVRT